MTTRCKFRCESVRKIVNSYARTSENPFTFDVEFFPVTSNSTASDDDENKTFWKWTPSGKLNFTSINADRFQPGKEYYLDITEVPATNVK